MISPGLRRRFAAEAKEIADRNRSLPPSQRAEVSAVLANRHRPYTQEFFDDLFVLMLAEQDVKVSNYESNLKNLPGLANEAAAGVWEAA